jgi:hypothetical protein
MSDAKLIAVEMTLKHVVVENGREKVHEGWYSFDPDKMEVKMSREVTLEDEQFVPGLVHLSLSGTVKESKSLRSDKIGLGDLE